MTAWGIIKGWMESAHIKSLKELSERTGIPLGTLKDMKKNPQNFRAFHLNSIREATGMTDEDFGKMALAAGEGR